MSRRLLAIAYHFPPIQGSSGVHRTLAFARYLRDSGWSTTVLTVAPTAYAAGVVVAGLIEGRGLPWRARAWLPMVLAVMHMAWGCGFIVGAPGMHSRITVGARLTSARL